MKARTIAAAMFVVVTTATAACGGLGGGSASSPPGASANASPSPQAVATPAGFPTDVPVYPGARLTAGAAFAGAGETTFGMEWETQDILDKVHAFYASKLTQGDWAISFSGGTGTTFSAVFSRKGSKENGLVAADSSSGVTKISLSLFLPA